MARGFSIFGFSASGFSTEAPAALTNGWFGLWFGNAFDGLWWGDDLGTPSEPGAVYGLPRFIRRVLDRSGRPGVAVARDTSERLGSVPPADMAERISVRPGTPTRRIGRTLQ